MPGEYLHICDSKVLHLIIKRKSYLYTLQLPTFSVS